MHTLSLGFSGRLFGSGIESVIEDIYIRFGAQPVHRLPAKPFINETEGLPDRFQMEIEENVNPGGQEGWFSKIPFQNGKKYGISNNCL